MQFIKQVGSFDLGDTPIENIFINDFMPMATNGTYVMVYLLGYKYAHDRDLSISVDYETIAKTLGILPSDVLRAWDFWEEKGVIKKHKQSDDPSQYSVEFLSLKQLYIENTFKTVNVSDQSDESASGTYQCSPSDLIEANKVPEIKEMFYHVNQLVRRSLVPNEMMDVLEWIYNYNMDPDLIVRAFMYCVEQKKIKNVKYVGAVIRNWYDHGVTTTEKLDAYLEKNDERYVQYEKIFRALGFHSRYPSESEKETMNLWLNDWNFPMDVILKACENSKKTSNPNINYINSILRAWNNDGIVSVSDLENMESTKKAPPKKQTKSGNNRFHNFEQRTAKYSNDELEKLLKNKD